MPRMISLRESRCTAIFSLHPLIIARLTHSFLPTPTYWQTSSPKAITRRVIYKTFWGMLLGLQWDLVQR